jgi:hypothetical protein
MNTRLSVAAIAAATALASLAFAAPAFAASISVGNPAINRATTDTFTNFTIIDTNNPVTANGTLDTFSYYAANTNSFEFVLVDAGNVVKYISPTITPPSTGLHTFNALVGVQAGWNLGVHFDSSGTIPFDGGGNSATYTANNSGSPTVGVALTPAGTTNRIYSWGATGTNTLIVDDNLACPGAAYSTIQAAVNAANPGDTITVCAGTYPEHVAVNKSLTINGPNVGVAGNSGSRVAEAIVDGTDTDAPFAITADNVTIDGFTVKNGSNGQLFSGIWSQSGTKNSKVQNNIITQNGIGVWAQCGGNCLIQNNLFDANNKSGPGTDGISADSTTGLTINNNEFKNHTAGNPVLFQATGPDAHVNLVFSNNLMHDNACGCSAIYALALNNAQFTGNDITSDTSDIRLGGGDHTVAITKNILHSTIGVNVTDDNAQNNSALGLNTAITVNRNSLTGHSTAGVDNSTPGQTASVDATCNWWGNSSGPSGSGPGTGDPVSANVTFQPWLTTSDLANGPCNGPLPQVTVTIVKNVDGVHATTANANSSSFPMLETWTATNFSGSNVAYTLSPVGLNTPNPYEAKTSPAFDSGANYTTHEDTSGNNVGASCSDGKPFALVGYTSGDTLGDAQSATPTLTEPSFTGMTTSKFVIVWNKTCPPATLTIVKKTLNGDGTFNFTVTNGPSNPVVPPITTVGGSGTSSPITLNQGTYNVNELTPPAGWTFRSVSCVYNNQSIGSPVAGGEQITVSSGDSVTCTFTNGKDVNVTIVKNMDGVHATAANSNSSSFPMLETWTATNFSGTNVPFTLGPVGLNTPNPYEAKTAPDFSSGANYTTNEVTTGAVVGPSCDTGFTPFALVGYTTGDTLAAAQAGVPSAVAPNFTNMTTNKFVVVWNKNCPPVLTLDKIVVNDNSGTAQPSAWTLKAAGPTSISGPGASGHTDVVSGPNFKAGTYTLSESAGPAGYTASQWSCVKNGGAPVLGSSITLANGDKATCTITNDDVPPPPANACGFPNTPPLGYTVVNGTPGNDVVTSLPPFSMFLGHGGNDTVMGKDGGYVICTEKGNDIISIGNGDFSINAGDGNNTITTKNGTGFITTGKGNDTITIGDGAHTINVGDGQKIIKTGNGNQKVTAGNGNDKIITGSGDDVIKAGNGNNTVLSGAGNDTITVGNGNNVVDGGPGTDSCTVGSGSNTVVNCSP